MRNLQDRSQRYPIILFFALTFILSWAPWYLTGKPLLLGFVPSVVGLIMAASGGEFCDLLRRAVHWRVGIGWWAIAIFGQAFIMMGAIGIYVVLGGQAPGHTMLMQEWFLLPVYFLFNMLMPVGGAMGEEWGWRGYALPKLQDKYGPLVATLILGTVWGAWHLPVFFTPGSEQNLLGIAFFLPFIVGEIGQSVVATWLYNKTKASFLVAGITWHAANNVWVILLIDEFSIIAASQGKHVPEIAPPLYAALIGVEAIVGLAVVLTTKGRLGLTHPSPPSTSSF